MGDLVLVAYATRYGSTEETAHVLAETLRQEGIATEVRKITEVPSLMPYSGVVVAAALYMGRLHKNARHFLSARRDDLARIPVILMVPGPVGTEEKDRVGAQQQLDKELARMPWLHPLDVHIVGGKWDPAQLPFPLSWTLRKVPARDARDWEAIRVWAHEIAGKLQPAMVAP